MAAILLPRFSRGTALVVRMVVVSVPALVGVAVAMMILLVALFMNERRQRYALRAAGAVFKLAAEMTGLAANDRTPEESVARRRSTAAPPARRDQTP